MTTSLKTNQFNLEDVESNALHLTDHYVVMEVAGARTIGPDKADDCILYAVINRGNGVAEEYSHNLPSALSACERMNQFIANKEFEPKRVQTLEK